MRAGVIETGSKGAGKTPSTLPLRALALSLCAALEFSVVDAPVLQGNTRCTLLPKLLPNAVGRSGKETDRERSGVQDVPTNRGILGCTGTGRDAALRIWRPVL